MKSPLKELRKSKNFNQNAMACLLEISKGHLSDIEHGYALLREQLVEQLCDLGLDGADLAHKQRKYKEYTYDCVMEEWDRIAERLGI